MGDKRSLSTPLLPAGKKTVRITTPQSAVGEGFSFLPALDAASPMFYDDSINRVNTGGGKLYRFLLCGRRDKRKVTASGLKTKKAAAFEGLDFDDFMNPVTEAHVRTKSGIQHKKTACIRWFLNFLIGVVVALVAVSIIYCTRQLTKWRFTAVYHLIDMEKAGDLPTGISFIIFLLIGLVYALVASLPVIFVEPASGSSGIPEVKMILNGVKMPRITRIKTLICRVFGNIFSVSSGLPAGYEGPMVSIGAAISAGISQGKSTTLGFDTRWSVYNAFRNDKEKRDFIVCGASAGIAAAFNAPVGGVLFSYEESASFWHKALTWRAFFTAMVAAYVIALIQSGMQGNWGELSTPGMCNFGDFFSTGQTAHSWNIWELPFFIAMGAVGGIFGAIFVQLNKYLTMFRLAKVNNSRWRRFWDVTLVQLIVSAFAFWVPYLLGTCSPLSGAADDAYASSLVPFYCAPDEYNDIASFWFTPTEEAIRQLFHFPNSGQQFPILHLGVFFLIYTTLMCLTAGTSVPAGLFIPTLLGGSALGRFVGQLANQLLPGGMVVDAGTYSLIGAAAMLGGQTRMTISLAVILVEATGNYQYGLPIMATLMAARLVGNMFNHGLYDMLIELRKWPMLEDRIPKTIANELRVADVMTGDVIVFQEVEKVGRILEVLKKTEISGFPVVYSQEMMEAHPRLGNLAGYIQRKHLAVILANRAFHRGLPSQLFLHKNAADAPPTPYPMPPVMQTPNVSPPNSPSEAPGSRAVDELHENVFSPLSAPAATPAHWGQRRVMSVPASTPRYRGLDLLDETVSNQRALMAAATGRSTGSVRHIRVRSKARGELNDQFSPRFEGTPGAESKSLLRMAFSPPPISNRSLPIEDEDFARVAEPEHLAALYNALYEGEYRYPDEPLLLWDAFESSYPRYPDVSSIKLSDDEKDMYIDLRPYMDPTPISVHVHCGLSRAFRIFRELGMRHLLVTNNCHDVVGIISRTNLTASVLHAKYVEARETEGDKPSPPRIPVVLRTKDDADAYSELATEGGPVSTTTDNVYSSEPTVRAFTAHSTTLLPEAQHAMQDIATSSPAPSPPPATYQGAASIVASSSENRPAPAPAPAPRKLSGVRFVDYEDTVAFDDEPDAELQPPPAPEDGDADSHHEV